MCVEAKCARRTRGQLLIIVLWVMGLVSVAIGALAVRSSHELRLGQMPFDAVQRQAIVQAAAYQAIAMIQGDDPSVDHLGETWATGVQANTQQPLLQEIAVGAGTFSVGLWQDGEFVVGLLDEERRLNVNTADLAALQRLIEQVQAGDVNALAMANAIVDWRDAAEGQACQGATPACHNALLETIDELRLVPGMTPQLFEALEPYVTVYGQGTVNVNTAPAVVLDAIGCPGEALEQQREQQPFSAAPASCPSARVTSSAFRVPVEARVATSSVRTTTRIVIDRTGRILTWQPQ